MAQSSKSLWVKTSASVPRSALRPEHQQPDEHHRQADGQRERLRVAGDAVHEAGDGVLLHLEVAGGGHDVAGAGVDRAVGDAVVALVAEPGVAIGQQLVLETPLGPNHLLAGEGLLQRGAGADDRARTALVATAQGLGAVAQHAVDRLRVGDDHVGLGVPFGFERHGCAFKDQSL